ncbi:Gfo/Idh/MocA family protein [Halobacterium litoreum]|uniref:Gfo/Idh/MocA family protein n=1 Tax=Halobacterium litoreum TaxID=2039234 RepID=A0ABD5NCR4_9EURY|nr:Gfo/Idh/MocA family oxidoreductase [Halobacterium litoreum]UHH14167.1 Gfo/Idh/MocA family oxidoreductase [Halobacterium litoreum]
MTESLSVGVLGYGFMGEAHANALARLPMFFPDAPEVSRDVLIGRDEDAAREAAERLGFNRVATDWRDAIDDVDAFYNLGPNHVHVEPSIAALDAGVHVLCEKPLAPTLDDAERMVDAAESSDAIAGTAFNYRFVPAVRYAKRLLDSGELGEVRHARFRYLQDWLTDADAPWTWRMDADSAGSGALGDLGAHSFDLARFLVGDVDAISGHRETFVEERTPEGGGDPRPVTVDDAFSAQAEFACGAMGTFEATRCAPARKNGNTFEIDGTGGAVRFDLERPNELDVNWPDSRGFETVLVTDDDDPYGEHWWPPGHVLGWEHTFVHENYEFLSAAADGGAFEPGFGDGLAAQRLLDAVARSDDRREWVSV